MSLLAQSLPDDQVLWVSDEGGEVLALYVPAISSEPVGAVLLVQDQDLHSLWPSRLDGLRRYLPEHGDVVQKIGRRPGLVHELIGQEHGEQVGTVDISILARAMPARVAGPLGVETGTPSLTVVRRYVSRGGRLFLASVSEHPGDRFTYTLRLERGWQAGGGSVWSSG